MRFFRLILCALCVSVVNSAVGAADLRLVDAVKRRDHKLVASLASEKAAVNAAQPDGEIGRAHV